MLKNWAGTNPNILTYYVYKTHLRELKKELLQKLWDGEVILHGVNTNSRGIAILFKNSLQYKILQVQKDDYGNMLIVPFKYANQKILLINAYMVLTLVTNFFPKSKGPH